MVLTAFSSCFTWGLWGAGWQFALCSCPVLQNRARYDPPVEATSGFRLNHAESSEDKESQHDGDGPRFDEFGDAIVAPKDVAPRLVCAVEFEPLLQESSLSKQANAPPACSYEVVEEDAELLKHLRFHASVEEPPVSSNASSPVRYRADQKAKEVEGREEDDNALSSRPNMWPGPWLRISAVVVQSGTYRLGFRLKSNGRQPPPQLDDAASAFHGPEAAKDDADSSIHTGASRIDLPLDQDGLEKKKPTAASADSGIAAGETAPPPLPVVENGVHTVRVGLNVSCYAPPQEDGCVCVPLVARPGDSLNSDHPVSSKQHSLLVFGLPPTEVAILPGCQSDAESTSEQNSSSNTEVHGGATSNLSFSEVRAYCGITCEQALPQDFQDTSCQEQKCVPAVKGPRVYLVASTQKGMADVGIGIDTGRLNFLSPNLAQQQLPTAGAGVRGYQWPFRCPEDVLLRGLVSSIQFTPRRAGTYFVSCEGAQEFSSGHDDVGNPDRHAFVKSQTPLVTFVHGNPDFAQSFGVLDGRTLMWEAETMPAPALEDERGGQVGPEGSHVMSRRHGAAAAGPGNNTVSAGFHRIVRACWMNHS